jgi:membrane protein DedA with SNARE-associated domain
MVAERKITRADIEAKLQEIKGDVDAQGEAAKPIALAAAVVGVVGLAALAYVLGRRRGRKKTTVVEIRRV